MRKIRSDASLLQSAPGGFTAPTDISPLVASLTGFNVTPDNVPRTGLDSKEVKGFVAGVASTFFATVLTRNGDGSPFTNVLSPARLEQQRPLVNKAR